MNAVLAQLSGQAEGQIATAMLVFIRISAAMALLPAFGEQIVPARIKLGLALAFAVLVAPAIWFAYPPEPQDRFVSMIVPEVVAGLTIGILFRLFVIALQVAGTIAGQSTSLSQIFGAGVGADQQTTFSSLLVMAGLALAVMAGLHVRIVEAFILSYEIFPPGQMIPSLDLYEWGVGKIAASFAFGFTLAGPFVLISVVYNLGLGVINKAMPQLMVAFVGAPAISFGGLVMLLIVAPFLLDVWRTALLDGTDLTRGAF